MKLRATYHAVNFNPFVPKIEDLCKQIRYAEAEVPDDSDMDEMRRFAEQMTPDGFKFVKLEKVKS